MKVALVHDYLNEFGGAERVLLALSEIWPQAPIYTAFYRKGGEAYKRFKNRKIIASWVQKMPGFSSKLYSPLRFLAPLIWNSFVRPLADYDLVISSSSWYITKGFGEICYCHTPPRWLYGYQTAQKWQKYWPVRIYAAVVGHFMRQYDFNQAQKVDYFIANSREVQRRIEKFYRREAKVIYPPVELPHFARGYVRGKQNYYLIVARMVESKNIKLAIEAANKTGFRLKIVGDGKGSEFNKLKQLSGRTVKWLGYVDDQELAKLYAGAKAFLALAKDEDFGITPVEAMLMGTPVVAFKGGGYLETVAEGKTGVFFEEQTAESLGEAIKRLERMGIKSQDCVEQAKKFSKERFKREIREFVLQKAG